MERNLQISFAIIVYNLCSILNNNSIAQSFPYPSTLKQLKVDTIFGRVIVDDYRWMEDMNSQQMKEWVKAQSNYANSILDKLPGRDTLLNELEKLDKLEDETVSLFVTREGGRYFYTKTSRVDNVNKLYYRQGKDGKEKLLFDPTAYTKAHKRSITFSYMPSKDGKNIALALSEEGKLDINTVKVLNVDTKTFHPDSLYPVMSVQAWSPDNKGFLYSSLQTDNPNALDLFQDIAIKYHQLGSFPKEDRLIVSRLNNPKFALKPSEFGAISLTPDNQYMIISLPMGKFYASVFDLNRTTIDWKVLPGLTIYNERIYFVDKEDIKVSPLHTFDSTSAEVLIPKSDKNIEWFKFSKDYLFVVKTSDGINTLTLQYHLSTGKLDTIQPPYVGNAWIIPYDVTTNDCYINVNSWKQPTTKYNYDPVTKKMSLSPFNINLKYPGINDLVVEEVEVKSHDGVMVPLSIIFNKNIKKDGRNVMYMHGYGAYGVYGIPFFNFKYLPLLNRGVIIAITHVRGGGEKGEAWHRAGFKQTKPNTWKDFIASAQYLVDKGYTSPKHIISEGFSAGGILVGRAMTERPDLFAATIHNVPLSNPLRGEIRPNGLEDANEFGTLKDSTEAMGLIQMDSYLNVEQGVKYPAVLAIAGINDTRVPVWQPAKLVAALQNASASGKPVLLFVNYDGGHLGSADKLKQLRFIANQYAFALWQAGHKNFQRSTDQPKK